MTTLTQNRFFKTAAIGAVALSLALPAAAQAADRKTQNALIGGILGAVAGGLIGGDATGALVGAGAGALIGASTTGGHRDYRAGYDRRAIPTRGYAQPTYGYRQSTPAYGYGQPSYGYAQPTYGYGRPQEVRTSYEQPYGYYGR